MRINREQFLRVLESVQPGLSPQDIVEQSTCFAFKDGHVFTYNDEVACKCPLDLGGIEGSVPSAPLLEVLRKMTEENLRVEINDDSELVVRGKRKSAGVRIEAQIALPFDIVDYPKKWAKIPDDFAEAVGTVYQCAGTDETKFYMTCLHIHPEWIEACDNFQLCHWPLATGFASSTLIRGKAVKHVATIGATKVGETKGWTHFKTPTDLILSCRRYIEDYPDTSKALRVKGIKTSLPKGLTEAASVAEIFSKENSDSNLVRIDLSQGEVKIRGQGTSGWYEEVKKLEVYEGDPISFHVSPKLFGDMVKKHSECVVGPGKIKIDGGSYTYIMHLIKPEVKTDQGESDA